ncbi:MAG: phosphate ABC transporter substrate-binding protein PstS [Candidatus Eremiobacteraeota bacterium]|nr:phosphate ABC transporter substrate-binding protein PstS [Candidatus Eremiobacteraeota bacterium]
MHVISLRTTMVAVTLAAALTACSNQTSQTSDTAGGSAAPAGKMLTIVGAGSSFDLPFFSRAFSQYGASHPGVRVDYQSIGSGGGIRQFTARTVDFGASDVPMGAKELAAIPNDRKVMQLPVTLGGVAIAYNVPDAPPHLRLNPQVLTDIFLGKITNWSDPQIAALNPGFTPRNLPIAVVHRADGSGTTYIFSDYMSKVSPQWKDRVGVGKTVPWIAASAQGYKGTEGVAGAIRNNPGAIGYVELSYAMQSAIPYAMLQNKAGRYVLPSLETVGAAAAAKPNVNAKDFSIVDQGAANAYPIAGYSWVLLYQTYADAAKQAALHDLFVWMETDGQKLASQIEYVPLPDAASKAALASLQTLGRK